jgi:hypothetical protein
VLAGVGGMVGIGGRGALLGRMVAHGAEGGSEQRERRVGHVGEDVGWE